MSLRLNIKGFMKISRGTENWIEPGDKEAALGGNLFKSRV